MPSENAVAVVAGPVIIMAVTLVDAEAAGIPQRDLALRYSVSIQQAIQGYRDRHTYLSFVIATLKTIGAWTLFGVTIWLVVRVFRRSARHFASWCHTRASARGVAGFQLVLWERSQVLFLTTIKALAVVALLFVFSFLISYSLGLFPQTAGISTTLLDYLGDTFKSAGAAIINYLPSAGVVVLTVLLSIYALKALRLVAHAIQRGELNISALHPEMAIPTYQLARIVIIVLALIVMFPYLPGGKSDALKGVSIFLGVVLSLGSSSAVSNVLAGLVLTYMRPFHASDRVMIDGTVGDVVEKTLLVTRLRTIKNVEVVIPNGAILSNQILNYSALARSRGLILNTTVTIGYDAPWRTVHELLVRAALGTDGLLSNPAPFVLETSLNDFHISYELNAYTDRANETHLIYSRLHEAIQDSFNKAGIEIMSPSFYALRDGNAVTIPQNYWPADYEPRAFSVKNSNAPGSHRD